MFQLPRPADWMEQALCRQVDPELFFPEKGQSNEAAKRICFSCPVQVECARQALTNRERYGVWGGLSDAERRQIRSAMPSYRPKRRRGQGDSGEGVNGGEGDRGRAA